MVPKIYKLHSNQGYTNERSHNPSLECLYSKSTSHFVSNHLLADDYESENGLKDFIYHTLFFSAMKSDESIGMGTRLGHCFMVAECICGSDATTLLTMEHIRPPVVSFFNRRQHLLWLAQIRFWRSPSLSHKDSVFGSGSIQMVRREGDLQGSLFIWLGPRQDKLYVGKKFEDPNDSKWGKQSWIWLRS